MMGTFQMTRAMCVLSPGKGSDTPQEVFRFLLYKKSERYYLTKNRRASISWRQKKREMPLFGSKIGKHRDKDGGGSFKMHPSLPLYLKRPHVLHHHGISRNDLVVANG
jgi:hypothetical protein